MVTDLYKLLYQGQLAATVTTLATMSAEAWIIKHIAIVNNDTVARTFALYRQGTAAANIITPPAMVIPAGGMAEYDGTMTIGDTETIRGIASAATMLTISISGDKVT
jgi:hypothetical protein